MDNINETTSLFKELFFRIFIKFFEDHSSYSIVED